MDEWKTEVKTDGGAIQEYTIRCGELNKITMIQIFIFRYQNLVPLTTYYFRVISYNEYGISNPCNSQETVSQPFFKEKFFILSAQVETPSKVYLEYGYLRNRPFYRETWFVVALAAASIVIIIMLVAILCVKSKTYKYKGE